MYKQEVLLGNLVDFPCTHNTFGYRTLNTFLRKPWPAYDGEAPLELMASYLVTK